MLDKNGKEILTGNIVKVEGGYFKNSNGLFYVERAQDTPGCANYKDIWLHKINKNGAISESNGASQSFPLKSYCSDRTKNRLAAEHNRQNATIELVDNIPLYAVSDFFKVRADSYEKSAELQRQRGNSEAETIAEHARFFRQVAERCRQDNTPAPKMKDEEKGIKFYYNGIRLDGSRKILKCYYSIDRDNNSGEIKGVSISAADYERLPSLYFDVTNNSDIYTDYFDSDRAYLDTGHPLFKYALYAAYKGIVNGKTWRKPTEQIMTEWKNMADPGQPTKADYDRIEQHRADLVNARKIAEEKERQERADKVKRQTEDGRKYIEEMKNKYPLADGHPVVTIEWSEHPAFYSYKDSELKLSVASAEEIFKHYDTEKAKEHGGYFKTSFKINFTMPGETQESTYEGRYDIGDLDGGLINHIRDFGAWNNDKRVAQVADYLEGFTSVGRIVSIEVAPYAQKFFDQQKEFVNFILGLLSSDDLKELIRMNSGKPAIVEVYMEQLFKVDPQAAMEMQKELQGER